jgi:hypothetical protein
MPDDYIYHQGWTERNRREQFEKLIDKNGPVPKHVPELGPCWIWKGSVGSHGYGLFYSSAKSFTAHRFAWTLAHGAITKPYICHRCDNRLCVNPNHLFEGTATDNNDDMTRKGRARRVGWPNKSTPEQVLACRRLWQSGSFTMAAISKLMGITHKQVESAIYKWKGLSNDSAS